MAYKISESAEKVVPAKKTISVTDVKVSDLRFVDGTGDITANVINEFPEGIDTVSFKITIELPSEE